MPYRFRLDRSFRLCSFRNFLSQRCRKLALYIISLDIKSKTSHFDKVTGSMQLPKHELIITLSFYHTNSTSPVWYSGMVAQTNSHHCFNQVRTCIMSGGIWEFTQYIFLLEINPNISLIAQWILHNSVQSDPRIWLIVVAACDIYAQSIHPGHTSFVRAESVDIPHQVMSGNAPVEFNTVPAWPVRQKISHFVRCRNMW